MRIYLANQSKQNIGGGWTFLNTFKKYGKKVGLEFPTSFENADFYFISGATMVQREEVEKAKKMGKKIILRVDNIPRNSRNRNTGTSRLYDFAQLADLIIYQSTWAFSYISPFLKAKCKQAIILNGADEEIFNAKGKRMPQDGRPQYLYVQYNRDETKQWFRAWYDFQIISRDNPEAHLWIVGRFSPEIQQYNFDFYNNEKFEYLGIKESPEDMAEIYRGVDHLLIPYFNDACSNTLIEAKLCGVPAYTIDNSGGTPEIMSRKPETLTATSMVNNYMKTLNSI